MTAFLQLKQLKLKHGMKGRKVSINCLQDKPPGGAKIRICIFLNLAAD